MALVAHPSIMGAPHRLRYFAEVLDALRACDDVAIMTGGTIHDWFVEQCPL